MTLQCRRLGPSDLTAAHAIRLNNPVDIDGQPVQSPMHARHYLQNQYLVESNTFYRTYGVEDTETGRLWCYGMQKLLTCERAWVLTLVISDQNANNGLIMNGLGLVMDAMMDYAESLRYYRYYTVTPADRAPIHDRVWSRISQRKRDRYDSVVEETVPERTVSAFGTYWEHVMGQVLFDKPAAIRHLWLKPELRD